MATYQKSQIASIYSHKQLVHDCSRMVKFKFKLKKKKKFKILKKIKKKGKQTGSSIMSLHNGATNTITDPATLFDQRKKLNYFIFIFKIKLLFYFKKKAIEDIQKKLQTRMQQRNHPQQQQQQQNVIGIEDNGGFQPITRNTNGNTNTNRNFHLFLFIY